MEEFNSNQTQVPPQITEKPTSVTVFGILNMMFGFVGLLLSSVIVIHLSGAYSIRNMISEYRIFLKVMNIIGFGFSIWLIALGIGLLIMKKWARNGAVLYCWLGILIFVIETIVNILALTFDWTKIPQEEVVSSIIGIAIGAIGGLGYPVLLLIFMQSAKVKQAFSAIGG